MHKLIRIAAALMALICLTLTVGGCAMVSVNPERDNAQVLAVIDGQDLTKSAFNNTMATTQLTYASGSQEMPTGKDLAKLRSSVADSVINNAILAAKAKKEKMKVDENAAKKSGKSSYESIKEDAAKKYDGILKENYTDDKTYAKFMEDNEVTVEYANKALSAHHDALKKDSKSFLEESVGTIDDKAVTHGEYEYYLISEILSAYSTTGSALDTSDDDVMRKTNKTIFENIALNRKLIKYAEDNKIDVSNDDIKSQQETLQSTIKMYFSDDAGLESFLESYYMSAKQYKEYQKEEAKAEAASAAIQDKIEEDLKPTDNDLRGYFNEHKDEYDTSTVSACHILAETEDKANEVYEKAKDCKSKEDFEKIIKQYDGQSGITEATDLSSFTKSSMVKEFSDAAFSMKKDTVSEPVKTEYGYHVIYVYDVNKADAPKLEDNREQVEAAYKSEKAQEEYENLEKRLKEEAKIEHEDKIKDADEEYIDKLKEELKVETHENII